MQPVLHQRVLVHGRPEAFEGGEQRFGASAAENVDGNDDVERRDDDTKLVVDRRRSHPGGINIEKPLGEGVGIAQR